MRKLPEIITVNVTAYDIEKGVQTSCMRCPIARAFKRKIRTQKDVAFVVSHKEIRVYWKSVRIGVYPLPQIAQNFIRTFDAGGIVDPTKFSVICNNNLDY